MKRFINSIISPLLAVLVAAVAIGGTYHFTAQEREDYLQAGLLDGVLPGDINAVEFVVPKGTAYPVNGVVTINTVFVDKSGDDGNVSGAELENSFITFSEAVACGAGTAIIGNKIVLPPDFNVQCQIQIEVPGVGVVSNENLVIEPVSCAALQTTILRGYGSGFENITPAELGTPAGTEAGSGGFDFSSQIDSIDLVYPSTSVPDAQTFQIHMDFLPDISIDPINGVTGRAEIVNNNGTGIYDIKVRDEGDGNGVKTASNFAYVFNDLLGVNSPVSAYPDPMTSDTIQLLAKELGVHGNDYVCLEDGAQVNNCFDGGTDGNNEGEGVLTVPLTLDPEILQGETALVFADNSAGEIEWISAHPSMLEVVSLTEAQQQDEGAADFQDEPLDDSGMDFDGGDGAYNVTDCDETLDDEDNFVSETCTIEATVPISYDITGIDYTVNVSIEDEIVPVTVQGSTLSGVLEGSGTYTTVGGASIILNGTVTGVVSGSVAGQFSGTVNGQIQSQITASLTLAGQDPDKLEVSIIATNVVEGTVTESTLTDVPGSFVSTVKKQEDDISHLALLYAKRPGSTILTAIDKQGCIASFDIEIIEQKVILEMVGRDAGDVLDVSDTVQIDAFVGGANQEKEELKNITASSGIEWFSSNEDVASIDQTGLLTALKPGVTNITARYDTGDAEIGTIESIPLQVTVNKISGLRITFDDATEDKLPAMTVTNAHKSVIIAVHNPEAAGQTFVIEGQTLPIELPMGTYSNDISKIEAIVDQLETDIASLQNSVPEPIVQVEPIDGFPGMLILQPINQDYDSDGDKIKDIDENNVIDIDTTALEEDVAILPTYSNAIPLPASETFELRVIAEYDNGATKLLPPTQFTWVNTPINYLEQASLDTGLIKFGEISGTSTVVAEFENADGSVVQSNYLTITVESGPVIEYVRRIGSGSITKGSRINLQTKVSDVDTIADIASISTSLVFSNFSTYTEINGDPSAIWFAATPFLEEVTVVDAGGGGEGEGEGEGETTTTTTQSLVYKTYDIPVEIPVDQNLFNGVYKLILSISDTNNHTLNYVYPIFIGEIGKGDVNDPPDGVVNMVDVIIVFQIAAGLIQPTPAQLEAANVDGIGGVNMIDVILLFNKVTS